MVRHIFGEFLENLGEPHKVGEIIGNQIINYGQLESISFFSGPPLIWGLQVEGIQLFLEFGDTT